MLPSPVATLSQSKFHQDNHTNVVERFDTHGVHHWKILTSSHRKSTWLGFEPTTTEFRSDVPTVWGTRPWVQLTLWANLPQSLQTHALLSTQMTSWQLLQPSCSIITFILIEISHRAQAFTQVIYHPSDCLRKISIRINLMTNIWLTNIYIYKLNEIYMDS